jgi:YbgC/YbaW family acyl-CoA thioester hydrolase
MSPSDGDYQLSGGAVSGRVFEHETTIRFGDVDHERILYYPRLFHICHVAMEEMFRVEGGLPYHEFIAGQRRGLPTVQLEASFERPMPFGDVVVIAVSVLHLGTSSLRMRYRFRGRDDGEPRAEATVTTVCVDLDSFRPTPIPDEVRQFLGAFRE